MSAAIDSKSATKQKENNPTGWATTATYLGGALACLAITAGIARMNKPAAIAEYGKVGQKFFADFTDPTLASSLEVFTFDSKNVEPRQFKVERSDNGQWVIPSHHDYPADAKEQLAQTAASVIGIQRGAMVTRWANDHAKYGVINPKQETLGVNEIDGIGQRLTLQGDNNSILADFIVGKPVDDEFGQYYVRHPEEDEVYITSLEIDLSTKFTDWIDTILLDLSTNYIRRITINDYSFDEQKRSVTEAEITELTRDGGNDDWKLASLDQEKEELQKDAIQKTLDEIINLAIEGVRPKQKGLTPDWRLDRNAIKSQRGIDQLERDLMSRGFLLQPSETGDREQLDLISRQGELLVGIDDGLVYRLQFGRVFTGSQEEMEIGFASTSTSEDESSETSQENQSTETETSNSTDSPKTEKQTDDKSSDSESVEDAEDADATSEADSTTPGRYLFVRVDFDEALLEEKTVKPTEPTKSARLIELEQEAEKKAKAEAGSSEPADTKTNEPDTNSESDSNNGEGNATDDADTVETELEKLQSEFATAQNTYKAEVEKYDIFQRRIKNGKQKAEKLNHRFAKWYYVISGASYDSLALDRSKLVTAKPTPPETETTEETGSTSAEESSPENQTETPEQKTSDPAGAAESN